MTPQQPRRRPSHSGAPSGRGRTPRQRRTRGESVVGRRVEVQVGEVAHGGFCIARHEGRAIFVRHAVPGERVVVEVTDGGTGDRFWRADAVEVLEASPHRVEPACPYAGPGRCGGCDWQHVALPFQRELKRRVVVEQLDRLAHLEIAEGGLQVEPVAGEEDGLRWRTRLELAVDDQGRPGLRRSRSRSVVAVEDCLIASEGITGSGVLGRTWPGVESLTVADADRPEAAVVVEHVAGMRPEPAAVTERVEVGEWAQSYRVDADGFWQVHRGAAGVLVETVMELASPEPGLRALDLYCGVGLFTAPLADLVRGEGGRVTGVEGDGAAVEHARENLAEHENADVVAGDVSAVVGRLVRDGERFDLVVLDPPRSGAGAQVCEGIVDLEPGAVVYVACDPAALARDVATFETFGYELVDLRAYDAFPMTHHVECVALLLPAEDEHGVEGEDGEGRPDAAGV